MTTPDTQPNAPVTSVADRSFVSEVLVSAGPRKSAAEYRDDLTNAELCEDCGGLCWVGDRLIFWLCDGGSNARILPRLPVAVDPQGISLPGFSARILAQDLGQAFVEHLSGVLQRREEVSEVNLIATVFGAIAREWEERLRRYIDYCEAQGIPLVETLPKLFTKDTVLRRLDWTTTFTGGAFFPQEQRIILVNYGASGGIITAKSPIILEPNTDYVGLMATVKTDEGLQLKINAFVNEEIKWLQLSEVEGFAFITDGLKQSGSLQERLEDLQQQGSNYNDWRKAILNDAYPVEDDKAVIFGHFI